MTYKPNYDEMTKSYNDALNVLSGGKYTPLRRKSDVTQTSTFDKSLNSGYNNSVGANHDSPVYGNAQTMPSLPKGGGRIPLDSTYGGIQNAKTYTPSYGGKTNGTIRASSPTTYVWRKDFGTPTPTKPQTPAYRPGEGFITKPENQILSADERENIKITQLPYKPDEHGGTYEQYSNHPTGFGELKLAANDVGARAGISMPQITRTPEKTHDFSPVINEVIDASKRGKIIPGEDKLEGDERFSEDVREEISIYQQIWSDAEFSYSAGIIDIYEKEALQTAAHNKAEEVRYRADHPVKSFFNSAADVAEYIIFDLSDLGDISYGTVYAADLTGPALQKMYGNADNLRKIIEAGVAAGATVHANSKGRSLGAININGQRVHVDVEYPQGNKPPNVHVQIGVGKQTKRHMINSLDEFYELNISKKIKKNHYVLKWVKDALRALGKIK